MKKEFLQKVIPVLSLLLALVCTACSGKESGNPEKLLLDSVYARRRECDRMEAS